MKKPVASYIFAYLMWAVFIGLGVIFIIISRNSLGSYLSRYYTGGNFQRGMEAQMIDRVYFLVLAFALLILYIVVEEYFRNGVANHTLGRRLARVFGFQLLFFFLANAAAAYLAGFSILIVAALILEIAISALLLWYGYRTLPDKISSPRDSS